MTDKQQVSIEMNRVIAEFVNYPQSGVESKDPYYYAMKHCYDNNLMKFHSDLGWLHGAWGTVLKHSWKILSEVWTPQFYVPMKEAMITGNITEAHRVLYDAIIWLNKQNDNGR